MAPIRHCGRASSGSLSCYCYCFQVCSVSNDRPTFHMDCSGSSLRPGQRCNSLVLQCWLAGRSHFIPHLCPAFKAVAARLPGLRLQSSVLSIRLQSCVDCFLLLSGFSGCFSAAVCQFLIASALLFYFVPWRFLTWKMLLTPHSFKNSFACLYSLLDFFLRLKSQNETLC